MNSSATNSLRSQAGGDKRNFSYRKVSLPSSDPRMGDKLTKDPGIYFSREDKFEGKFE